MISTGCNQFVLDTQGTGKDVSQRFGHWFNDRHFLKQALVGRVAPCAPLKPKASFTTFAARAEAEPRLGKRALPLAPAIPGRKKNEMRPFRFFHLCAFAPWRLCVKFRCMTEDLQKRIQAALANPQNMGELANADSIGTVGNADCGEMLRLWVKFKEQNGKRVIDRATFQSFGCETAIAVASLATELIRGKTQSVSAGA